MMTMMTPTSQQRLVDNYDNKDDNDLTMAVTAVLDFTDEEWESMKRLRKGNGADRGGLLRRERYNCRSYKSGTFLNCELYHNSTQTTYPQLSAVLIVCHPHRQLSTIYIGAPKLINKMGVLKTNKVWLGWNHYKITNHTAKKDFCHQDEIFCKFDKNPQTVTKNIKLFDILSSSQLLGLIDSRMV